MQPSDFYRDPVQIQLLDALTSGDTARIEKALAAGADPNAQGTDGMTPLYWALGHQQGDSLRILLAHGADPNHLDPQGDSVVHLAAGAEKPIFLEVLLRSGANPNLANRGTETPLHVAVDQERSQNVLVLLKFKADPNRETSVGITPVLKAAMKDDWVFVRFLLDQGALWLKPTATGSTLAYTAYTSRLGHQSPDGKARDAVVAELQAKGVKFPPPSPAEVLAAREPGGHHHA